MREREDGLHWRAILDLARWLRHAGAASDSESGRTQPAANLAQRGQLVDQRRNGAMVPTLEGARAWPQANSFQLPTLPQVHSARALPA